MNSVAKYDQLIAELEKSILENPEMKYRMILSTIRDVDCPYLKRKIRKLVL